MGISLYVEGSSKQHGDRKLANMVTEWEYLVGCMTNEISVWIRPVGSRLSRPMNSGLCWPWKLRHQEAVPVNQWWTDYGSHPQVAELFGGGCTANLLTFETLETAPNLRCAHHGQGRRGRVASCDHNRAWFSLGDAQTYSARWAVVGQILLHKSRGLNCRCDSKFQSCPQLAQFLRHSSLERVLKR